MWSKTGIKEAVSAVMVAVERTRTASNRAREAGNPVLAKTLRGFSLEQHQWLKGLKAHDEALAQPKYEKFFKD